MRSQLIQIFQVLGLEVVDQDRKDDYGSSSGYIVVKSEQNKFVRIDFYDDSYGDGSIDGYREVTPKPIQKMEYV